MQYSIGFFFTQPVLITDFRYIFSNVDQAVTDSKGRCEFVLPRQVSNVAVWPALTTDFRCFFSQMSINNLVPGMCGLISSSVSFFSRHASPVLASWE
jgi:hypothetical protein